MTVAFNPSRSTRLDAFDPGGEHGTGQQRPAAGLHRIGAPHRTVGEGQRRHFLRLTLHGVTALDVRSEEQGRPTENRSTPLEKGVYDPWRGIACRSPAG
ncbi:hypothetical protein [Streptomyces sp. NPDC002845]